LYGQYIGENVDFTTLNANILGPQAYVHPASELLSEFTPPAPYGKAYMMAEFGHLITQAPEQWDMAKQYAGGGFQEYSDAIFNSALVYELSALQPLAEPLLLQIEPGKPGHIEAKRLLAFLRWFEPVPADPIPDNSILREFIGESGFSY
jgi:hypothetical protein